MKFTPDQQYQAMHRIEIDLTEFCDMHCHQCNRAVDLAPSKRMIRPDTVAKFICESTAIKYPWQRIHIIGGEPTLHPQFLHICGMLTHYKQFNPTCVIELRTNTGPAYQKVKHQIPADIQISTDRGFKVNGDDPRHHDFYVAATDFDIDTTNLYCSAVFDCGMSLSPYGYMPCHMCTGITRVFGYNHAVKTLAECTEKWWLAALTDYCGKCGMLVKHHRPDLMNTQPWNFDPTQKDKSSPAWKKAFVEYDVHKTDHLVID